jgi:hypothetical protein
MQRETAVRANFTQLVLQVFSSPLHFIGSAYIGCTPISINPTAIA